MGKEIVINGGPRFTQALIDFCNAFIEPDKQYKVRIAEYKFDLSDEQRALYRVWLREIARVTGNTEDYMHEYYKENHLVPVLYYNDPDFRDMVDALHRLRQAGNDEDADTVKNTILSQISTARGKLKTKLMSLYMDRVYLHATEEIEIQLPIPDDKVYQREQA